MFGCIIRIHAERTTSTRNHEAEEGAALTFRFESGVVGSFLIADNLPSPHNFESGTGENHLIPTTGENFYTIFGTAASLSAPSMTRWSYDGVDKTWNVPLVQNRLDVPDGVPFEIQLAHFIQVCRGEETPKCTVGDGSFFLVESPQWLIYNDRRDRASSSYPLFADFRRTMFIVVRRSHKSTSHRISSSFHWHGFLGSIKRSEKEQENSMATLFR